MTNLSQSDYRFVVSCEHASDRFPASCEEILKKIIGRYETHRIFDPGAKPISEEIASRLDCPLFSGEVTRLAIDLNRSLGNPGQFSDEIFASDERIKADLIAKVFLPFRSQTLSAVERALQDNKTVVHLSVHSFTKVYQGKRREVDLGILFDNARPQEALLGKRWTKALAAVLPEYKVRANEPYEGADDGHVTALRRLFPGDRYLGIEIELSQELELESDSESWGRILCKSLLRALTA